MSVSLATEPRHLPPLAKLLNSIYWQLSRLSCALQKGRWQWLALGWSLFRPCRLCPTATCLSSCGASRSQPSWKLPSRISALRPPCVELSWVSIQVCADSSFFIGRRAWTRHTVCLVVRSDGCRSVRMSFQKGANRIAWGGRRDLNPRHSVPQTDALPAELLPPLSRSLAREKKRKKENTTLWPSARVGAASRWA
jgi:hypothetical protein